MLATSIFSSLQIDFLLQDKLHYLSHIKSKILSLCKELTFSHILTPQLWEVIENNLEKRDIVHDKHFPLFPKCFLLCQKILLALISTYISFLHLLSNWKSQNMAYQGKS